MASYGTVVVKMEYKLLDSLGTALKITGGLAVVGALFGSVSDWTLTEYIPLAMYGLGGAALGQGIHTFFTRPAKHTDSHYRNIM